MCHSACLIHLLKASLLISRAWWLWIRLFVCLIYLFNSSLIYYNLPIVSPPLSPSPSSPHLSSPWDPLLSVSLQKRAGLPALIWGYAPSLSVTCYTMFDDYPGKAHFSLWVLINWDSFWVRDRDLCLLPLSVLGLHLAQIHADPEYASTVSILTCIGPTMFRRPWIFVDFNPLWLLQSFCRVYWALRRGTWWISISVWVFQGFSPSTYCLTVGLSSFPHLLQEEPSLIIAEETLVSEHSWMSLEFILLLHSFSRTIFGFP